MEFSNAPVDPASLPQVEEAQLHPVCASYTRYRLLSVPAQWAPLLLGFWLLLSYGVIPERPWGLLMPLALLAAVVATLLGYVEAKRRAYGLREQDLIYRSGLFIRRTEVVPLARIQHVELASGPLERVFALVRLSCFTAGGAVGGLVLQGLDRDTAERVRQYLLARIRERDGATDSDG